MLKHPDSFVNRHLGPNAAEREHMLEVIGLSDLDQLIQETVPEDIQLTEPLAPREAMSEHQYLRRLKQLAQQNKRYRSYIGQGYYDVVVPPVILRNVFENPGWYTQYTPTKPRSPKVVWRPFSTSRP